MPRLYVEDPPSGCLCGEDDNSRYKNQREDLPDAVQVSDTPRLEALRTCSHSKSLETDLSIKDLTTSIVLVDQRAIVRLKVDDDEKTAMDKAK